MSNVRLFKHVILFVLTGRTGLKPRLRYTKPNISIAHTVLSTTHKMYITLLLVCIHR